MTKEISVSRRKVRENCNALQRQRRKGRENASTLWCSRTKITVGGDSIQWTPKKQQNCPQLKQELPDALYSNVPPAGRITAKGPMHLIKLLPHPQVSFGCAGKPRNLKRQSTNKQTVSREGKPQQSTIAFGNSPVLEKKNNGKWCMCIDFKPLSAIKGKEGPGALIRRPTRPLAEFNSPSGFWLH